MTFQVVIGGYGHCNVEIAGVIYDCDQEYGCERVQSSSFPYKPDARFGLTMRFPAFNDWREKRPYDAAGTVLSFMRLKRDNQNVVNCATCTARFMRLKAFPPTPNALYRYLMREIES